MCRAGALGKPPRGLAIRPSALYPEAGRTDGRRRMHADVDTSMRDLTRLALRIGVPLACVVALVVLFRPNDIAYAHAKIALLFAVLAVCIAAQTRGALQNVVVTGATLCIGFALVDGYFDFTEPNVDLSTPGMWRPDADFGAAAVSKGPHQVYETIDGKTIYRATYTLDERLLRTTRSAPDAPRVRFFGDSYTFGVGLNDSETLPQVFADLTGANVENYGFPGYSPAQTLYAMQKGMFDKDIATAKLFILETAPFHVDRTACLPSWAVGAPRYVLKDGKLDLAGHCRSYPWQSLASYQHLLAPLVERPTRADVETYIAVVEAIVELARTKYKVPIIILNMERDDPLYVARVGFPSKALDARFRAAGAIVVPDDTTAPINTLRIPGDGHPNGEANRQLAHRLAEVVARDTTIKLPRGPDRAASAPEAK